jgi:hypothetical protein
MEIFGHLIDDREIIGISPIKERAEIELEILGYPVIKKIRYSFSVLTKLSAVYIESNVFNMKIQVDRIEAEQWKGWYGAYRNKIAHNMGETITNNQPGEIISGDK